MGILIEYLKALKKGLENPEKVLEGWINDAKLQRGTLSDDETEEIIRRRVICNECPFMSKNAVEAGNYHTSREDEHCIHCSCPIKKKTASLESNCGIEEFNKRNSKNQLPLKWEKYVKPLKNDEHSETSGQEEKTD